MCLVEGLETQGWVHLEHFLTDEDSNALAKECALAWDAQAFRQARVGRGDGKAIREDIRRDHVMWLNDEAPGPAVIAYHNALEQVRQAINRRLYLGLDDFEGHFAVYPPGAYYKPHLDRHQGTKDRVVTAILYLNPAWKPEDGGRLKLWTDAESQNGPVQRIEPRLGTLVAFLAGEHWHEVEESMAMRMSVTGWFRVRI